EQRRGPSRAGSVYPLRLKMARTDPGRAGGPSRGSGGSAAVVKALAGQKRIVQPAALGEEGERFRPVDARHQPVAGLDGAEHAGDGDDAGPDRKGEILV